MDVRGIELSAERVAIALQHAPQLKVQVGDITDPEISGRINAQFNLIVMRDVIEHVPQREITFKNLKNLLKQGGYLYITFPPKFSAYGGHQQNARSPIKYIPFFQLLPESTIRKTGYWLKEKPQTIEQILHIYSIGLTIDEFEKHCVQSGLAMKTKELFLSRPIFKTRFGVPVIRFPNLLYVREFLSCGCEYLLQKK
jgi:SAM-dependent methyltransferase